MTRRILLHEFGGGEQRKLYATFDPTASGVASTLDLSLSNLVATPTGVSTGGVPHGARSSTGQSSGKHWVEFVVWSDSTSYSDIDPYIGITTSDGFDPSVGPLGDGSGQIGYAPAIGQIWSNGAQIQTGLATARNGSVIGMLLDLNASPQSLSWYVDGSLVATISIGAETYYAAFTINTSQTDVNVFCNFGQRKFEIETIPDEANEGWYSLSSAISTTRISSDGYCTKTSDTPANTIYPGRLAADYNAQFSTRITTWVWGEGGAVTSFGDVIVLNNDGEYDNLLADDYRDQPYVCKIIDEGEAYSTAVTMFTAVIERITADGENRIRITLRDRLALLDKPLQRALFLPSVSDNAANLPKPIVLGTARNIEPVIYDETNRKYQCSDKTLTSIIVVRDKADPLNPEASPEDWSYTTGFMGFQLATDPEGKIVASCSSTGGVTPSDPPPDALDDAGNPWFWIGSPEMPDGWVAQESAHGFLKRSLRDNQSVTFEIVLPASTPPILTTETSSNPQPLVIGRTYRWELAMSYTSLGNTGNAIGAVRTDQPASASTFVGYIYSTVGVQTGQFVATQQDVILTMLPGVAAEFDIAYFRIQEAAQSDFTDPNNYEDAVQGITFADFCEEIIEVRAELDAADWSSTSATQVNPAQDYDIGFFASDPTTTCKNAIDAVIDAFTGFYYQDSNGVIRFGRLFDPDETGSPGAQDVDEGDLLGDLQVSVDTAPGLTNTAAVRRNWSVHSDADFVTDLVDVPQSLRKRFMRDYQYHMVSSANLAATYRHALQAPPVAMLVDDTNDGQTEIDRVCSMYTEQRRWFRYRVPITSANEFTQNPGECHRLTHSRFGLSAGKYVMIVEKNVNWNDNEIEFVSWG